MADLKGKTLFITGASRGIGLAIGKRAAADGANVVIAAKTAEPHAKLPGTIYTAAEEIEAAGGKALPLIVDVREEELVEAAMAKAAGTFGGIDILINNASAISLTGTLQTPMKRYDLMHQINIRGTFLCSQKAIPYLRKADNPIATAAMDLIGGPDVQKNCRKVEIMADAAHIILTKPSREFTGNFCVDDETLASVGVTDLSKYRFDGVAEKDLLPDFFV